MAFPTDIEQYMLELINQARADPEAYVARLGIGLNDNLPTVYDGQQVGPILPGPKQPLAWNTLLGAAAEAHSLDMLEHDDLPLTASHRGSDGRTPHERIVDSGYGPGQITRAGENISVRPINATSNPDQLTGSVEGAHNALIYSHTHRTNVFDDGARELGVGAEFGIFTPTSDSVCPSSEQSGLFEAAANGGFGASGFAV
jgi:uncharacterized protein YkwD